LPFAAKFTSTGLEKAEAEAAAAAGATTGTTGGAGAAPGGTMAGGAATGSTPPAGSATGKSGAPYAAYINANRYIQVTPQVRRMAVGVVVAIDQAYVEDLVSQFLNCRLRFQPTQVQWQQDTRPLKPPEENVKGPAGPEMVGGRGNIPQAGGPGGAGGFNPMMGMMTGGQDRMANMMQGGTGQQSGMGMMMGMQGQMQGRMRGARPVGGANVPNAEPIGAGGTNTVNPATSEEGDPNIVQFALYGIISLYDTLPAQAETAAVAPGAAAPAKPDTAPKAGDQPKTDGTPKVDPPKTDGTPKVEDQPKTEPTPKSEDKTTAPKADDKKTEEKPKEGEAKKDGENKSK
jgi:hypothetical protein